MPISLSQQQTQSQVQRQELVPAQIQSLEILQAAMPELEQKLGEILASNPTLELVRGGNEQLAGNPTEGDVAREPADTGAEFADDGHASPAAELRRQKAGAEPEGTPPAAADAGAYPEESAAHEIADAAPAPGTVDAGALEQLGRLAESWNEYLPGDSTGHAAPSEEEEERRQHRFDSLVAPVGLQDMLLAQLRQQLPEADAWRLRIGEEIIGSIDETGYLRSHVADIAMSCGADQAEVKEVLALVQQFDPPGIGARDLRECLLLQLERQGRKGGLEYQAVSRHLDALGRNQIPQVARQLRVSTARVYEILRNIRQLRPYPGRSPDEAPTVYIVPEVTVFKDANGAWQVEPNREHRPQLRLSPYYLRLLRAEDTPAEVRQYIRQKLADGKLVLRALDQRQSTIERITRSLLRHQPDYFENGAGPLRPLTISAVAQELGLHETTIGRAVAEKYMQTPHGLVPFRRFFATGGVAATDGHLVSNQSVKQRIEALVRGEDPRKPLTDDALVKLLASEGLKIARRTVAKYREEMGIAPTHLRRSHRAAFPGETRPEAAAVPPPPAPEPPAAPTADDDIIIG